uniref:BTB domain-containing protein n=1 Tax=Panagrolaimus sp. JU765 TaxID=591449 RepID=A0AC34QDP6_9BILA
MPDFTDAFKLSSIADVAFVVNGEEILAHEFILYFRSPVFKTMFDGPMAPKSENGEKPVIKIDDPRISAENFKLFLEFLYSDKAEITGDNAFALLNMARMYDVKLLIKLCEEFLTKNLNSENVVTIANSASIFNDSEIYTKSISFIQTSDVLKSDENFCQMNETVLSQVLKMDDRGLFCANHCEPNKKQCQRCRNSFLAIMDKCLCDDIFLGPVNHCYNCENPNALTEIDLFQKLFKWGQKQCKLQQLEENPENMKGILELFLKLVRFPTMSFKELTTVVYPTKLLDDSAFSTAVVAHQNVIDGKDENPSPFSNKKRRKW